ncbi:peptidyl-prolyl cis-trans isomerase FKBP14-like [Diadema antillarum]|uniref:peptidyl-prolyl cis-trans isomerase FKBP14-like n=1 Tax=Diadema antillarum TaxID=105358 RepID=UPI003A85769D
MKLKVFLSVFLVFSCLVFTALSDEDAEVEVEDDEEEVVVEEEDKDEGKKPPPEIEWETISMPSECRTKVTNDDTVGIHFMGKLASDGSVFFDSRENNEKDEWISFPMGVGESIKGLELGLLGMCKEEIRKIVVEPDRIKNGRYKFHPETGVVPRDQKLIFEVEMMFMGPNYAKGMPNMFKVYDDDKNGKISHDEFAKYIADSGTFGPKGPLVDKLAKENIDKDDRNRDGYVEWEEFSGPKHDEL